MLPGRQLDERTGQEAEKVGCGWGMGCTGWIRQRLQSTKGLQNKDDAEGKIQQLPQQQTGPVKDPWPLADGVVGGAGPGPGLPCSAARCAAHAIVLYHGDDSTCWVGVNGMCRPDL